MGEFTIGDLTFLSGSFLRLRTLLEGLLTGFSSTAGQALYLNDLFSFEAKLSVDEVEDEIREDQNAHFIEGKALHTFEELTAILDYMPAGHETDDEAPAKSPEDDEDDLSELDAEEEEKLKNDESLKWDEDEEGKDDGKGGRELTKGSLIELIGCVPQLQARRCISAPRGGVVSRAGTRRQLRALQSTPSWLLAAVHRGL